MLDRRNASHETAYRSAEGDIARGLSVVGILVAALVVVAIVFYLGNRWPAKDQAVSRK